MEFYRTVFGGELTTSTFAEFHRDVSGPTGISWIVNIAGA
jgi:hypothetical protein